MEADVSGGLSITPGRPRLRHNVTRSFDEVVLRICSGLLPLFTIVLLTTRPAQCQVATAEVTGIVADNNAAVIPGATVKIENQGTHEARATVSGADDAYAVTLLQPDSYVVTITAPGFKSFVADGMVLVAGDRIRLDAALQVGTTSESVEVTTQPSSLHTDSTNVGSSVDSQALRDLPLNGRNFMSLVQVAPGVNAGTANPLTRGNRPDDRRQSTSDTRESPWCVRLARRFNHAPVLG